ncbi:phage protein [Staphylococcus xylosus]|uniref:DUF2977 domain-containing protein n=1 Tax=Staphylococcus xylosus TaxID=1288 RepID=UPI00085BB0AE|nr:DUF2977 domain-containing protein [Staphylococcus xylosus]PTI64487.1 DUF2977 domain-containing protein [Staphylococcus xylosus]SCU32006.1 phage protein [Staphylococcus xylosus]
MLILLNDKNEITSYATVGSLENGFQINDELLPSDLKSNFTPYKYKLEDGRVVLNDNYKSTSELGEPRSSVTTHDEELWDMVANLQVQSMQNSMLAQQALQKVEDLESRGVVNDN